MEKAKGKGFLKVVGILMIIFGALGIIVVGIIGLVAVMASTAADSLLESGGVITAAVIVASILAIIGGVIELITGIIGVKNCNKPENWKSCMIWGIISLALEVLSLILSFVGSNASAGSIIINIIGGVAMPVLFIIGAKLNQKQYFEMTQNNAQ